MTTRGHGSMAVQAASSIDPAADCLAMLITYHGEQVCEPQEHLSHKNPRLYTLGQMHTKCSYAASFSHRFICAFTWRMEQALLSILLEVFCSSSRGGQGCTERACCDVQDEQAAMLARRPAARRLSAAIYGAEAVQRARTARLVNPIPTSRCGPDSDRPWRPFSSAGSMPASARMGSARTAGLRGGSERGAPPVFGLAALGRARGLGGPAACAGRLRRHSLFQGFVNPMPAWGAGRGAQAAAPKCAARCASANARRPGTGSAAPPQGSGSPKPKAAGLRVRLKGSAVDAAQWLRAVGRGGTAGGSGPVSSAGRDARRPTSGRGDGGAAGAGGAGGARRADLEERFAGFLARQQACQQACYPGILSQAFDMCATCSFVGVQGRKVQTKNPAVFAHFAVVLGSFHLILQLTHSLQRSASWPCICLCCWAGRRRTTRGLRQSSAARRGQRARWAWHLAAGASCSTRLARRAGVWCCPNV